MAKKKKSDAVENRPIIVKKVIEEAHGGHHGGAWKVAYADFVTAMMAFFLLMWLLGATTEDQRKGIADYFSPTLVQVKTDSAGGTGLLKGDSIKAKDDISVTDFQSGASFFSTADLGEEEEMKIQTREQQKANFEKLSEIIEQQIENNKGLSKLKDNVSFTYTKDGLRIDLVDEADYSMFALSTDNLLPHALELITLVGKAVKPLPNPIVVRGHTDSLPWASGKTMNNWMLSTARAEATRKALVVGGVIPTRFARIEGVADREPYNAEDRNDPRNRRMSITLSYMDKDRNNDEEIINAVTKATQKDAGNGKAKISTSKPVAAADKASGKTPDKNTPEKG